MTILEVRRAMDRLTSFILGGLMKQVMRIPAIKQLRSGDNLFALVVLILSVVLLFMPTGFEESFSQNVERVRGLVLEVDNSGVQQIGIVKIGDQDLKVRILNGRFKGKEINANNTLLGKMELDKFFAVDDIALMVLYVEGDKINAATAFDHYRIRTEIFLFGLFALFLIIFAHWRGSKALLSFLFAGLMIWKVMLPAFLKGWNPILVSLGVVTALTITIVFLIAGLNKKGLVAFLGALLGIILTCILALIFSKPFHIHGAIEAFSEALLYSGFPYLDLTRIFLAGVFTAASGAVMDIAMDVSVSMNEVINKKPDISRKEIIGSGFAMGRASIGTMITTLLLAYSGGYTATLMVFIGQGLPLSSIININYVAAEILYTIVGSFGLVTVAPFTAIVGGLIYVRSR